MAAPVEITVHVHDIVVQQREVTISSTCPKCGADLREVGLRHHEYQDQVRDVVVADDGEWDWDSDLPDSGESYLAISWVCGGCHHELVEHTYETKPNIADDTATAKAEADLANEKGFR